MEENNINIRKLIEYPKEGIISKKLFAEAETNHTLFCMSKGTDISEHTSTKEGTIHIIEGKGIFILGDKKIEMVPDVIIFMKRNEVHSIKAIENTSFLLSLS